MKRVSLLSLLLAVSAVSARAQSAPVGSFTMRLQGKVPSGMPIPMAELPAFQVRTVSDGRTVAAQITLPTDGTPMMQMLAGVWLRMIWHPGSDSAEVAVALPASLSAMIAAPTPPESPPPGYRLPFSLAPFRMAYDSLVTSMLGFVGALDSIGAKPVAPPPATARNLGIKRVVAGIACEEWLVRTDTVDTKMCMAKAAEAPALMSWFPKQFRALESFSADTKRNPFSGKGLVAIRMERTDSSAIVELVEKSTQAPPADLLRIPSDFKLFDPSTINPALIPPGIVKKS